MRIVNLTDKNQLNEFVIRAGGSFLQSWEWGEFQEKIREKIWRLGILATSAELGPEYSEPSSANERLVAAATVIKKRLPFGKSYFYCPKGPVVNYECRMSNVELIFENLFNKIKNIAKDEKVIFLRFEPTVNTRHSTFDIRHSLDVQPSKTLILNLAKSEEELLKAMHEKTRYNIRLAEKKGVKVIEAGANKFEDFWNLIDQTSGRDKFRPHGRDYYKAMLQSSNGHKLITNSHQLNPPIPLYQGGVRLFFTEYEGKLIATGIFSFFGDTATYLHGGSANEFRNVMAPYLLQWHVIKLARSLGFKYYDLYGIDDKKWPGVTRFKKGFGGFEKNYLGTFDLVIDKGWYSIYKMARKIRRNF